APAGGPERRGRVRAPRRSADLSSKTPRLPGRLPPHRDIPLWGDKPYFLSLPFSTTRSMSLGHVLFRHSSVVPQRLFRAWRVPPFEACVFSTNFSNAIGGSIETI